MKFTVLSADPIDLTKPQPLAPAPNVTETDYIHNALNSDQTDTITDLFAAPIEVITDYRGVMLYCAGGVGVHRTHSTTSGGNGFTSPPGPGVEEDVHISSTQGRFHARIRFE
jgi:hypothetical protein